MNIFQHGHQSRLMSMVETVCNVGSGMFIAWVLTLYVLPALLDVSVGGSVAFEITAIYTVASLTRSYLWRRAFA